MGNGLQELTCWIDAIREVSESGYNQAKIDCERDVPDAPDRLDYYGGRLSVIMPLIEKIESLHEAGLL